MHTAVSYWQVLKDGKVDWGFRGVSAHKWGGYEVRVKGRRHGCNGPPKHRVTLGHSSSGPAAAVMYDAALDQRGVSCGFNFHCRHEREQVRILYRLVAHRTASTKLTAFPSILL